jgi:hypothetical protein
MDMLVLRTVDYRATRLLAHSSMMRRHSVSRRIFSSFLQGPQHDTAVVGIERWIVGCSDMTIRS